MPAVMPSGGAQGPSCFDRVKIGFLMGACVGMASGAIFGGFTALRLIIFQFLQVLLNSNIDAH
jgi:ABC-type nitrate/sulfonate/bicarbonate transport system permease component